MTQQESSEASVAARRTLLDEVRWHADPLADETIARIVGDWDVPPLQADAAALIAHHALRWERLLVVNRAMLTWRTNTDVMRLQAQPGTPPPVAAPLTDNLADYL